MNILDCICEIYTIATEKMNIIVRMVYFTKDGYEQ